MGFPDVNDQQSGLWVTAEIHGTSIGKQLQGSMDLSSSFLFKQQY